MKKILIIDDDYEVRTSLSELLRETGYDTCEVSSGKAAKGKIVSENFDLALLDIVMPRMSGMDLLADIKKNCPKRQVIMITAFPAIENALDAAKKGACDYITKPFKRDELLYKIGRAVENARFKDIHNKLDINRVLDTLANNMRRNILRLLSSGTNMRLTDIAKDLNIVDHTKVSFHLKVLKDEGLIEQDGEKAYVLTPGGEKVLDCLKIMENYL